MRLFRCPETLRDDPCDRRRGHTGWHRCGDIEWLGDRCTAFIVWDGAVALCLQPRQHQGPHTNTDRRLTWTTRGQL